MAKIGISINEVLRDFLSQFDYTYNKYIGKIDIKISEIESFDLIKYYPFESVARMNTFLYLESPLEIFGHADQMYDGLINKFNLFIQDMNDEANHEFSLVSREVNKSIPSTFFFLSKTGARINNIKFVKNNEDEWSDFDVLITANPIALAAKPAGKISVKISAPYNKDVDADYTLDSILDFINDSDLRNKILAKIITTTYEELS